MTRSRKAVQDRSGVARRSARAMRDTLLSAAFRRWRRDGWVVQPHLECRSISRHRPGERTCLFAWIEDEHEENIVHLYPHPTEQGQPVEKTLLHELLHIVCGLEGGAADERDCAALEDAFWPILTPTQRRSLRHLVPGP